MSKKVIKKTQAKKTAKATTKRPKLFFIQVVVTEDIREKVRTHSEREGISSSAYVRRLLLKALGGKK